jgi:hypothetical protein
VDNKKTSNIGVWSEEARNKAIDGMNRYEDYVNPDGSIIYSVNTNPVSLTINMLTIGMKGV